MKKIFTKNISWMFISRFIYFFFSFLVGVVLARFLEPKIFGSFAYATAIFMLSNKFTSFGLNELILRLSKYDQNFDKKFSTVFWFNIFLKLFHLIFLNSLIYFVINLEGDAHKIFFLISITYFFSDLVIPLKSILSKYYNFKFISIAGPLSLIISGPLSLLMVTVMNFEIWSLVVPQLIASIIICFIIFYYNKQKILFSFQVNYLKTNFLKGIKFCVAGFLQEGQQKGDDLIIGYMLGELMLGVYFRAYNIVSLFHNMFATVLHQFSEVLYFDEDKKNLKMKLLQLNLKIHLYFYFIIFSFLFYFAHDLVIFIYGKNWSESATLLVKLLPYGILLPIYYQLWSYLKAKFLINLIVYIDLSVIIFSLSGIFFINYYGVSAIIYSFSISLLLHIMFMFLFIFSKDKLKSFFKILFGPILIYFFYLSCYLLFYKYCLIMSFAFFIFFFTFFEKKLIKDVKYILTK